MDGFQHASSMAGDFPTKPVLPSRHRPSQSDDIYEVGDVDRSQRKTFKYQPDATSSQQNPQKDKICFQLNQDKAGGYDTPIRHLVSKFKLPTVVKIQRDFSVAKNDPSLKMDDLLLFHFIGQRRRVPAIDEYGKKTWLFFDDQQLYDILPHDPYLEFKQFYGTDAVIKNNPLPKRLRIVKMSPKYKEEHGLEVGDILEINNVESRPQNSKTVDLLTLVCSCNGKQFFLTQHTTDIIYSTMISKKSLPLSAIVKRNLRPVRVRQTNDNRVYALLQEPEDTELQVIATRKGHERVLAIPLSCPIQIERVSNDSTEELLQGMLPAMYSLVQYTGKVQKVEPKPLKEKPLTKGPKPSFVPYDPKHSLDGNLTRIPPLRSKAGTYVHLQEGHHRAPDHPSIKPRLKPKPKPAMRSQSFAIPRPKPLEKLSIYGDATSFDISSSEPEETQPIYDDVPSLVSSRPEPDEPQPIYDDTSGPVSSTPEPEDTQPIYDDTAGPVSSTPEPEDTQPIYDDAANLEEPQPIYDDVANLPVFSRKTKSRFEQDHPRKGMGEYHSLRSASVDGVVDFLRELHFDPWIDKFRAASIDGEMLCKLDENYLLRDMRMKRIEAKRLVLAVKKKATTQYGEGQKDFYESDARLRRAKSLMRHPDGQNTTLFVKQTSNEV